MRGSKVSALHPCIGGNAVVHCAAVHLWHDGQALGHSGLKPWVQGGGSWCVRKHGRNLDQELFNHPFGLPFLAAGIQNSDQRLSISRCHGLKAPGASAAKQGVEG